MGEREITEQVEVTERESVHVCDFCGRSSDEFDGTFNEVYKNPEVSIPRHGAARFRTDGVHCAQDELQINRWIETPNMGVKSDEEKHYCDECHDAHLEVHNDDS